MADIGLIKNIGYADKPPHKTENKMIAVLFVILKQFIILLSVEEQPRYPNYQPFGYLLKFFNCNLSKCHYFNRFLTFSLKSISPSIM